jgi:uncharacterized protein
MADEKIRRILITGGTGLIGLSLTKLLLKKGYQVNHLSRTAGKDPQVPTFLWDVGKGQIDPNCIDGVDAIVHLAGAGIADKRWTKKRKQEIIHSRTNSIQLVYSLLQNKKHSVKAVISASGVGYYSDRGDELMHESNVPATDFLGKCCVAWEKAVDEGHNLGLRVVKFRTGVVLDKGGALEKLAMPIKLYIGSPLGSGKQWMSWIHLQDVLGMYLFGIENGLLNGVYNMVSPNPLTNKQVTLAVAKQLRRPLWAPGVPGFLLKLLLGEMSIVVLGSTKASSEKIENEDFKFKYPVIAEALSEIYG